MLKGSIPALVTPFSGGKIDYSSLEKLLNFHLENKTDGILLLGTTAETITMNDQEKKELLSFAIKHIKKRLPIIVGTGSSNVPDTVKATNLADELGADFALIVTPYYNKPNQEGLYLYYKELVKLTKLPIVIYNVPSRTGCNISAETVIKLANEFPARIVGIKEASGDLVKVSRIIRDTPETFSMLSGEDALNFPIMCLGGMGTISVTANTIPLEMHTMIIHALSSSCCEARKLHDQMIELNEVMFCDTNPIPAKQILAHMGLLNLEYRLPLCPTTPDKKKRIIETYEKFKAHV